ncbi:FecCD family ABC transporter permease [Mycobacterium tilburgii]|uniref:FecCD family ABC transporter permease n=1 Tax=Mycobacterium tilburgii TaxID=44467 RepID=UPI0021B3EA2B|nr:iron chelate uptake ABC transporter family permease subunit [Mycobacterium tilburgii]
MAKLPIWALAVVLLAAVVASMVVSVGLGAIWISPAKVVRVLAVHLCGEESRGGADDFIVWQLRAPRVIEGGAVGAGLALAGLLSQASIRNPLGDPFIFGLSSGSSVGAVLVITTGVVGVGGLTVPCAAVLGAGVAALLVVSLSRSAGRLMPGKLVMTGCAIAQFLAALTSFLLLHTRQADAQQQVLFWLLGSVAGARWVPALVCTALVTVVCAVSGVLGKVLNLLVLGDDAAAALGLNAHRTRLALLAMITLLTGTVVATAGTIGFVGLVIPNLARLVVGADHRRSVPVTILLGALLMVWSDNAARLVLAPSELPIGILTAGIGVPVFLTILCRRAGLTGLA